MPRFKVELSGQTSASASVVIDAENEADAKQKALQEARTGQVAWTYWNNNAQEIEVSDSYLDE